MRVICLILLFIFFSQDLSSQDTIYLKNTSRLIAVVDEVGDDYINIHNIDNLGSLINKQLATKNIRKIVYKNGYTEHMKRSNSSSGKTDELRFVTSEIIKGTVLEVTETNIFFDLDNTDSTAVVPLSQVSLIKYANGFEENYNKPITVSKQVTYDNSTLAKMPMETQNTNVEQLVSKKNTDQKTQFTETKFNVGSSFQPLPFDPFEYKFKKDGWLNIKVEKFVPSKEFLQANPDFLKTGTFRLSTSLIEKFNAKQTQEDLAKLFGKEEIVGQKLIALDDDHNKYAYRLQDQKLFTISSNEYVAVNVTPQNSLSFLNGALYFDDHYNKGREIANVLATFNIQKYGVNNRAKEAKDDYWPDEEPNYFDYINVAQNAEVDNIILDFTSADILPVSSDLVGNSFPSYAGFTLKVKTINGQVLKSYNQLIFFKCQYRTMHDRTARSYALFSIEYKIVSQCYASALKAALNQFSADTLFLKELKNYQSNQTMLVKNDSLYPEYIKSKNLIQIYTKQKGNILTWIDKINDLLKSHGETTLLNVGAIDLMSLTDVNKYASTAVSTIGNLGAVGINLLAASKEKKEIAKLKQAGEDYVKKYREIVTKQESFINNLHMSVVDKLSKDGFFSKDKDLAGKFTNYTETFSKTSQQAQDNLSKIKTQFSSQLSTAMNAGSSSGIMGNNSGMGSANSGGMNSLASLDADDCSTQANLAFYKSAEYKKITGSSARVIDGSYAKIKLAELTLQYCSSKLSQNDIAAINSMIQIEKNTIAESNAYRSPLDLSGGSNTKSNTPAPFKPPIPKSGNSAKQ